MKLRVIEGKSAGKEIPVKDQRFLIGRAEDCHLRPASELISRHHCAILVEEGYIGVRDFGSKNGTYVNDERIVGERELKAGDRLTVGHLQFEVHVTHRVGAKKQPPVHDVKEAVARTASNAAKDPLDVTQWLASEATDDTTTATAETKEASVTDTESISLSATQTGANEDDAAETAEEEEKSKGRKQKKQPGKLPPIPNASKDSQDAAASVLSKMRRRR